MRATRAFVFAGLALALLAGPAPAQQPAPATAPAAAPAIAESHLAVAREVVVSTGLSRGFDGMIPQIAGQIRDSVSRTRPELIRDMEEALKVIIVDLSRNTDQMIGSAARLFAARMTEAELKEINTFFKTPTGQKYVNTQGPLLNDLFAEMQVFSQTLGNIMMDQLREALRKKGHQL